MDLLKTNESLFFWIFLAIGFFVAYMLLPKPKIVYKYPTPENAGKVTYVDNTGVCYRYKAREVPCPADKSQVEEIKRD